MDKSLSEESKDLLRNLLKSEVWVIYESFQQEQIKNLRILATSQKTIEGRCMFYDMAQGREDSLTSLKDVLYG